MPQFETESLEMANNFAKFKTWDDLSEALSIASENLRAAATRGLEEYEEWELFADGRSVSNIQADLVVEKTGLVNGDVTKMKDAFESFKDVYDFMNNVASPVQGDRFAELRQFNR